MLREISLKGERSEVNSYPIPRVGANRPAPARLFELESFAHQHGELTNGGANIRSIDVVNIDS